MYFIDEAEADASRRKRYPWGMLVLKDHVQTENNPGYVVYEAVVLDQVLRDIEAKYADQLHHLVPFSTR